MTDAPDKDSKTEEASEKKIRDALEKGNVPVSQEAAIFASLAGILVAAGFFVAPGGLRLAQSLQTLLDDPAKFSLANGQDAAALMLAAAIEAAWLAGPFALVIMAAGIAASLLQTPPRLVMTRIQPDWSRISIGKGWERMSGASGRAEFIKACCKFAAVTIAGAVFVQMHRDDVFNAMFTEPGALPEAILRLCISLLVWIASLTLLLAVGDIFWTRIFWRQELRMTRQEVKDEHKQMDGDPIIKSRMRSLARDRARHRMFAAVEKATFVVVNPTHYAVALRYVREEGGAPVTVAKGKDIIALRIRALAEDLEIPIIEDKALARSLHDIAHVDKVIPPQFFKAVAEIVFQLYSSKTGGNSFKG